MLSLLFVLFLRVRTCLGLQKMGSGTSSSSLPPAVCLYKRKRSWKVVDNSKDPPVGQVSDGDDDDGGGGGLFKR